MKEYNQSPLPFQGQKRHFVKYFKNELKRYYNDSYIFIDLFGGSGLLSHTAKSVFNNAKVVFNDFDNFKQRLNNIENTNKILKKLRYILKDYQRSVKITGKYRSTVLALLEYQNKKGYVDYITLSSSLKFGMSYAKCLKDFETDTLYNRVRTTNYCAEGY